MMWFLLLFLLIQTFSSDMTNSENLNIPLPIFSLPLFQSSHRNLGSSHSSVSAPLFPGYGTHYVYVFVGTPPQRQSVIVDTGSQLTAFPCTGCKNCGKHTDNYWNIEKSSTAIILKCENHKPCKMEQAYSEGSSWEAFKVTDKFWVGGATESSISDSLSIDFTFGCQTSETGLFQTQKEEGIMGMSNSNLTLPAILQAQGISSSRIFALCLRRGGGFLTLGGVNKIHHTIPFALLVNEGHTNWFTVHLIDIKLHHYQRNDTISVGKLASFEELGSLNAGMGAIVDSGTTVTHFPSKFELPFSVAFKKLSNFDMMKLKKNSDGIFQLTNEELEDFPEIVFELEATTISEHRTIKQHDSKRKMSLSPSILIRMRWNSYLQSLGNHKYSFTFIFEDNDGTILGADFMNEKNVIFDPDNHRIGFTEELCKFEQ